MTDRELFQKTVKSLPSLAPPLLGTLLVGWLGAEVLPQAIFTMIFGQGERIEEWFGLLLAFLAVWALLACVKDLLQLGAFRFCLDRGEGKEGSMPWTILPQWRRYIGWVLWTTVLSVLWSLGVRLLGSLTADRLEYWQRDLFFTGRAYVNVVLSLLSLFVFSLLLLSVKTAYLRTPERSFWHGVGFGLKEGLKKWPKTIGTQLKFVVPVSLGVGLATVRLNRLALRMGSSGISMVCSLARQLLYLLAQTWTLVLYGHLAAARYDREPPVPGKGETPLEERPVVARLAEGLMGTPPSPFPAGREMKLIRGGPWYYRDSRKGPTIPGPLERK